MPARNMEVPRTGITAVIQNGDGKFLVGKRMGSHGAGSWQFPGGHLELDEGIVVCAERETLEETNLKVTASTILKVTEDIFRGETKDDLKHYITIFAKCVMNDPSQEPELMEPNKCEGWHWKSWEELKDINKASEADPSVAPLFLPLKHLIEQVPDLNELFQSKGL